MTRILLGAMMFLACLLGRQVSAGVSDGHVDGIVNVQWTDFAQISNELGDNFFPGQKLEITLTGSADINWSNGWEKDCFLGICNKREWINHNFKTPQEWPILFRLVDDNGAVIHEFASVSGRTSVTIPVTSSAVFNRKLALLGMFTDGSPAIDPSHSQGQFVARVDITTAERVRFLPRYLSDAKPTARALKQTWVRDPFLLEQNRAPVARALVTHAQLVFPANNPGNAQEHRELLEYAGEIDPSSSAVGIAVASMYMDQGNFAGAEAALVKLIKDLQQKPGAPSDLGIQLALASAHAKLAATIEQARGYADLRDLAAISASYTAAIDMANSARAPMLAVQSLMGRAFSSRSRNTPRSLQAAEADFRLARDRSPLRVSGLPMSVSPSGTELLAVESPERAKVSWRAVNDGPPLSIEVASGDSFLRPLALTRAGRVLAATSESVGWIDLKVTKPAFEPTVSLGSMVGSGSTNGNTSLVILAPPDMTGPPTTVLLKDDFSKRAIVIDGKPPVLSLMASVSDRYLVLGAVTFEAGKPPTQALELRHVGLRADTTVRRVMLPFLELAHTIRVSADGRHFGALMTTFTPAGLKRQLIVWDDASSEIEVSTATFPPPPPMPAPIPGRMPVPGPPLPPGAIVGFDFSPDDSRLLVATADGRVSSADIVPNAALSPFSAPGDIRPTGILWLGTMTAASGDLSVVEGRDLEGSYIQFVDWKQRNARLVRNRNSTGPFNGQMGYWTNAYGRTGSVTMLPAPLKMRSHHTSDGSVIAEDTVEPDNFGSLRLLNGGLHLCMAGTGVTVRSLADRTEKTIAKPSQSGGVIQESYLCLPKAADGEWTLVRHRNGEVLAAAHYKGLTLDGANDAMPPVPDDIVAIEQASAAKLGQSSAPMKFDMPQFGQLAYAFGVALGTAQLEQDTRTFAVALPRAVMYEAATAAPTGTRWISLPYVLLQEPTLTVRRVRLPVGAIPIKILPSPADKVIYLRGAKIYWKTIDGDTEGTLLLDLPALPMAPTAADAWPPIWRQVQVNSNGTRLLFASANFNMETGMTSAEQRMFEISGTSITPLSCGSCGNHAYSHRDLLKDNPNFAPLFLPPAQTDVSLDHLVVYNGEWALIHAVRLNKIIGALPARQIYWVGDGKAIFLSGRNEFSLVEF